MNMHRTWITKEGEGIDSKVQWCELGAHQVLEVDPSRVRGHNHLIMVCPQCRKEFPDRQQCWYGREQYQYYWDLGNIPVPHRSSVAGKRQWYEVELTKQQLLWLRASGYDLVIKEKK